MTSSCSTLQRLAKKHTVLDENDWADGFIQFVKKAGRRAPFIVKYLVSKTLAERGASVSASLTSAYLSLNR